MEIRHVRGSDIAHGLLETLANLSAVPERERGLAALQEIIGNPNTHLLVVDDDGSVVAALTLLLERKLIHDGGMVGHVEDVATRKGFEGRGFAAALITEAMKIARQAGAYKVILNCSEPLEALYGRFGFRRAGIEMRFDCGT